MTTSAPDAAPRQPDNRSDARFAGDEIDLLGYAATCWRYRYVILIAVLLIGVVTYVINRRMVPTWEVTYRLMGTETGLENNSTGSRLSMVAFRELVESPTLIAEILNEFSLLGPPHNLTPEKFLSGHVDVEIIRDSTIIEVAVRLKDRDLLVKLARRYADRVVETALRLNTEGIDYTAERIREQRDAVLVRLKAADQALQDYQRRGQLELLENDVATLLARRPEAVDLSVRIQGAGARLQQSEAELAKQDRVRTFERSVDSLPDPARDDRAPRPVPPISRPAAEPTGRGTPPPSRPPSRPAPPRDTSPSASTKEDMRIRGELLDPYVNPVYEALARDVSTYRAELAGLEQERKELVSRLQLDAPTAAKLARLYEVEGQIDVLTRERDVARDAYLNAANKYEDARLQSTIRSPRLQILDAALPPDAPVAPRALRNTVAAMLLAFSIAAIAVIAYDGSRR